MISYNDDELIFLAQEPSGQNSRPFLTAKTNVNIIYNDQAPLKETNVTMLLELVGDGSGNGRSGVDIVMVLDVSKNMKGSKLREMKTAMQFLIRKLSPIDRLSVVTISRVSDRLCALRRMTKKAQSEVEELLVNALSDVGNDGNGEGGTNIAAGLQTAVGVLKNRRLTNGRVKAVMLISGDKQIADTEGHSSDFYGDLPIYTFGVGYDYNPKVLNDIAGRSNGGTFSIVEAGSTQSGNLTVAVSQCLAGLLTVAVQNLKLVVSAFNLPSKINDVYAGSYPCLMDSATSSVTIHYGDLYNQEMRKVLVNLALPSASDEEGNVVLHVKYSYSVGGLVFDGNPLWVNVSRTKNPGQTEKEEVKMEETRIHISKKMIIARKLADIGDLESAQLELVNAQCELEDVVGDRPNLLINLLRYELVQFQKFVQTPEIYVKKGQAFALASESSHSCQRFAARGDAEMLRLFATPRMDAYLEQANSFVKDSSKPLTTTQHDAEEENAADPLTHVIIEPHISQINKSLKPHFQTNFVSVKSLRESLAQIQLLINTVVADN